MLLSYYLHFNMQSLKRKPPFTKATFCISSPKSWIWQAHGWITHFITTTPITNTKVLSQLSRGKWLGLGGSIGNISKDSLNQTHLKPYQSKIGMTIIIGRIACLYPTSTAHKMQQDIIDLTSNLVWQLLDLNLIEIITVFNSPLLYILLTFLLFSFSNFYFCE